MTRTKSDFCDGITRRGILQAGLGGAVGLSLPDLLRLKAEAAGRGAESRDTAIIYLELAGGPTQHETYDPKPNAPVEYRGPFNPINTSVPGVQLSQLMVEQARIMDKLAVIRSIHHNSGSHGTSSHLTQTGYYLRDNQNRENEMPCIGSITARLRGANTSGVPPFVSLPQSMRFGRAAWLGNGYNPFSTGRDADAKDFSVPNLTLLDGLSQNRLNDRRALLTGFDTSKRLVDNHGVTESIDHFTEQAFEMVTGNAARDAFDIEAEDPKVRQRYGLNSIGQNCLLARRLVERGITYVTIRGSSLGSWDDHVNVAKRMKEKGPGYDRGIAALVDDLHARGLGRRVMVVAMGEFGRTPRVNKNAGRDHWGRVMSVLMAGGGLRTGQVVGSSDATGSVPQDRPYGPENVLAVMYRHLGIDPSTTFADPAGRPRYILEDRKLITELI